MSSRGPGLFRAPGDAHQIRRSAQILRLHPQHPSLAMPSASEVGAGREAASRPPRQGTQAHTTERDPVPDEKCQTSCGLRQTHPSRAASRQDPTVEARARGADAGRARRGLALSPDRFEQAGRERGTARMRRCGLHPREPQPRAQTASMPSGSGRSVSRGSEAPERGPGASAGASPSHDAGGGENGRAYGPDGADAPRMRHHRALPHEVRQPEGDAQPPRHRECGASPLVTRRDPPRVIFLTIRGWVRSPSRRSPTTTPSPGPRLPARRRPHPPRTNPSRSSPSPTGRPAARRG